MKLRAVHDFMGLSLESYEALYFSEEFNKGLCESVALERTLEKLEDDGKTIHRVVGVCPVEPFGSTGEGSEDRQNRIPRNFDLPAGQIHQWKTVPPF